MAGIGFRLNRLLRSHDPYLKLGGMIASVFLSSGPWLCTMLSIAFIGIFVTPNVPLLDQQMFRIIVNYSYLASLIGFGLIEMVSTRYLSDALFLRQERVVPTFYVLLASLVVLAGAGGGAIFCWLADLDWQLGMITSQCLASVTLIWVAMIFLSACKDFVRITLTFAVGMSISFGAAYLLVSFKLGIKGLLMGFTIGQIVIALSLSYRVLHEFGRGFLLPRDFLSYFWQKRVFVAVGFLYAAAVWIDKVVFWLSPGTSERVAPLFFKSSAYDSGLFLAYLTVVPSLAYFLVQMETKFYVAFRKFLAMLDIKAPLSLVEEARREVVEAMRSEVTTILIFQAFISVPSIVFASELLEWAKIPAVYVTVFRYAVFGAAFHVFLLFANILILYLDMPKVVARNYFIFLVLNGVAACITARLDYRYHGVGYAVAALAALVVSALTLNRALRHATSAILLRQPLAPTTYRAIEFERVSLR